MRFAESLGTLQLQNEEGTEIVTPETLLEQPLHKLQLVSDGTPLQSRQKQFNRPFNPVFIPAEYATINCCPMCIINPARCWECDPGPLDPTSISSMDPDQEDLGSTSFQVTFTGTFSGSNPSITFDKPGISVTIGSHTAFGISATFDITNASVGNYVVTVSDTGGSDTATLTLSPFINSIEPAMGLVGNTVSVTISGKGFGTAPSVTVGGNVTVSGISASNTQITANFNIPANSLSGGDQTLTVTNQGFSTAGDVFHVQVPAKLVRFSFPGTSGGIGPLITITNGNVVDLNGNIQATGECGMYRNFAFDIEEANGTSINGNYIFTEAFSSYSTTIPGLTAPPTKNHTLSGDGLVTDLQFIGTPAPDCPGANDHESFNMSFSVTSGGAVFPLSTVQHIDRGNFNGTAKVDAAITVP